MSSEKDSKHIYAQENKLYYYYSITITLEGIDKIKTEKNDNKTVLTITRAFTS